METSNQTAWQTFLMDVELARNYPNVDASSSVKHWNPILEDLLPSLLYVRLGSILDEFLEEYIVCNFTYSTSKGMSAYKTFGGRISYLMREKVLKDAKKVDSLRLRRNELAHEAKRSCTWDELDQAIDVADTELQHLGLSGPRPHFDFYTVREAWENSTDPRYSASQRYRYGLKRDGKEVIEASWTTYIARGN